MVMESLVIDAALVHAEKQYPDGYEFMVSLSNGEHVFGTYIRHSNTRGHLELDVLTDGDSARHSEFINIAHIVRIQVID